MVDNKKTLASIVLALSTAAGCASNKPAVTPVETVTGRKPVVEYFFSPSCEPCRNTDAYMDAVSQKLGNNIDLVRYCVATDDPVKDLSVCSTVYGQDVRRNFDSLRRLGGSGTPAIFVDGREVRGSLEFCNALGFEYGTDCLKRD
jgi:thiol-disulfide isomerase/thioredoxin